MFLGIQRALIAFLTFFMMLYGGVAGINFNDSISKYEKNVNSVEIFENTMKTAVPQTEIYNIIKNHVESELPEGKTSKKVIVLGYDGCRADALTLLNEECSGILDLTNNGGQTVISYCGGVNYPAFNKQSTSTAPGWCSMLTGQWATVHGITDNSIEKSNDYLTLLTTLVEDGTLDSSAFYVSWGGHFNGPGTTYWQERQYIEEKGLNVNFLCASGDDGTYENVMADLTKDDCSDFIFSIFEHCDHAGHGTGFCPSNPEYADNFAQSEQKAVNAINAIKSRATYDTEDWLIIITSDHGGYNTGHGSFTPQERFTFITTNKVIDYNF